MITLVCMVVVRMKHQCVKHFGFWHRSIQSVLPIFADELLSTMVLSVYTPVSSFGEAQEGSF